MSNKRGPYSSPRQQVRRKRILRTARVQLERHGLPMLTMQSLAATSEVSLKTLYNQFGTRDQLLLEAAAGLLDYLERSFPVQNTQLGIDRLLAYSEGAMKGFATTPEYARTIITILLQAEGDNPTANMQLSSIQRIAHSSLEAAAEQDEIHAHLNLLELSHLIAANQWGTTLMWEKGVLTIEELENQTRLGHYLILTPLCRGKRKKTMETRLRELLDYQASKFKVANN